MTNFRKCPALFVLTIALCLAGHRSPAAEPLPAGHDGFITVRDGHLTKPDGRRFRIWGVNLTGWTEGSTNLPPKDQAATWAAALASAGINCVRFHFLDLPTRNPAHAVQEKKEREAALAAGQRFKLRQAEKTVTRNARHTLWATWGRGPTLIEPVTGWLTLRELDGAVAVKVIPLDGASKPIGEPIMGRRMEYGWEIPLGTPATDPYLIEVVH